MLAQLIRVVRDGIFPSQRPSAISSPAQHAGRNATTVVVDGSYNNILFSPGLEADLEHYAATPEFKTLFCIPSSAKKQKFWIQFSADLTAALTSKGIEVVLAGEKIPRNDDEFIYLAEERYLKERSVRAIVIFASDYATFSQLTHFVSVGLNGKNRKEIIVIRDQTLVNGDKYFEEGALATVKTMGKVFEVDPRSKRDQQIFENIVNVLNTYKVVKR